MRVLFLSAALSAVAMSAECQGDDITTWGDAATAVNACIVADPSGGGCENQEACLNAVADPGCTMSNASITDQKAAVALGCDSCTLEHQAYSASLTGCLGSQVAAPGQNVDINVTPEMCTCITALTAPTCTVAGGAGGGLDLGAGLTDAACALYDDPCVKAMSKASEEEETECGVGEDDDPDVDDCACLLEISYPNCEVDLGDGSGKMNPSKEKEKDAKELCGNDTVIKTYVPEGTEKSDDSAAASVAVFGALFAFVSGMLL